MRRSKDVFCFAGKIMRVNLNNQQVSVQPTLEYAKDWLGGSGIAIKILYDELRHWVTPYDPANKLIFGAGALIGTIAPGACKINVSTLGPMTGGWASSMSDSYVGGELKYAGYDSLIIEGKAHTPIYLWIHDDRVEYRDASHLWGKTTWETLEMIRKDLQDPTLHILSIGPAGENLVRGACIVQDKGRAFGRCGIGAVMGAKNLKAIVIKGTGSIQVADSERFMEVVNRCLEMFAYSKSVERMRKYGTLYIMQAKQSICGICYKNFQECYLPEEMAKTIDPCKTIDKYSVAHQSFPGCAIGCGKHLYITEGPYAGLRTELNQWEVLGTLQGRLAIWEPTFMVKANALCNQFGLDVDAAGGAIGWAMECYQRGIIKESDTDGLKLNWGDAGVSLELIRKIAYREGFGNILAEGCARASNIVGRGSDYFAMHIKGQDLYEACRGALGWCLGTVTSTRGGGHTTGAVVCETIPGLDVEKAKMIYGVNNPDKPQEYEGKAKMVKYAESICRINNSLGICHTHTNWFDVGLMSIKDLADLFSAATGWETSEEELKKIAERQLNLEKAFNLRHTNFDRKDDLPTSRDMNEHIPIGPLAGWKMDKEKFNKMLDEYYEIHGWDKETSFPFKKTLVDLGLEYVANDLQKIGKIR